MRIVYGQYKKRGTFAGVKTGLAVLEKYPGRIGREMIQKTALYFTRWLIGIETLEDKISIKGGKNITTNEKLGFVDYALNNTQLEKLKLVVQTGLDPDEDVSITANGLANLAKKYNNGNALRLTVEVSSHIPNRGKGIIDEAMLAASKEKYSVFEEAFRKNKAYIGALRPNYEFALPSFQWKSCTS
jgi:hypothetical protein